MEIINMQSAVLTLLEWNLMVFNICGSEHHAL